MMAIMERKIHKSMATEARHRITVQRKASTKDGEGGHVDTWSDIIECFAAIYPIRAQQRFEYRSVNVEATHFVKMRYGIDILEKDRIVFGARTFEILTIENIQERGFQLWITCKEVRV
jgi:SPP1 family predicted phage head-tail adaptor